MNAEDCAAQVDRSTQIDNALECPTSNDRSIPKCPGSMRHGTTATGKGSSHKSSTAIGHSTSRDPSEDSELSVPVSDRLRCSALHPQELHKFYKSLVVPLLMARQAFHATDKDLLFALNEMHKSIGALVDSSAEIIQTHSVMAQGMRFNVLPDLECAADADNARGILAVLKMLVDKMTYDTGTVRSSYLRLLDDVGYLMSCTQLAIDSSDGYEVCEELKRALTELKRVRAVLADPCEFWLVFHVVELEAIRIQGSIQRTLEVPLTHFRQVLSSIPDDVRRLTQLFPAVSSEMGTEAQRSGRVPTCMHFQSF